MPAPLSLRIKERYMAKRANGLSQQVAADAAGISVRSAQRIDRGELQPEGQQQQRGRHWRTRADPLAEVWESVLVPMLEKAPQLEPQTLLLHLDQIRPGEEWFRRKRTLQRRVEQWRALHGPAQEVMFLQEHRAGVLGISDFTLLKGVSGDNEVGRSATSSLAGWVSAGVPGADAQGPGDAGTTDESPTQPVHGETTRWQQPGGCCRSGGHFSAQCPPD